MSELVSSSDEDIQLTKGQRRRAEIVALGRDLLIQQGYDQFVLRTVAAQAQIKLGNLQYYFPVREDLLETIGEQEFSRGLSIVREAIDRQGTPEENLTYLVSRLVGDWQQTGGRVYAVIVMLALHQERFQRLHTSQYKLFYRSVGELVQAVDPTMSRDDALHRARIITTLMDGSLFQVALHGKGTRADRTKFHEELVATILSAVAT